MKFVYLNQIEGICLSQWSNSKRARAKNTGQTTRLNLDDLKMFLGIVDSTSLFS